MLLNGLERGHTVPSLVLFVLLGLKPADSSIYAEKRTLLLISNFASSGFFHQSLESPSLQFTSCLMPEAAFQPPFLLLTPFNPELQDWAEHLLQRSRSLQELPLILVPPVLLSSWQEPRLSTLAIQSAVQTWLEAARLDDERLRIERQLIPHTPIYIPNTPQGQQFFQLAKAIADIPLKAAIVPKNQNQGYWFKTLHYYWQAKGVVLAQRLLGVIADPLGEDGVLNKRLSNQNLESLRLSSQIEIACFHLLLQGEPYIREWVKQNGVAYPFETTLDLLLELLHEEFLVTWQLGPDNPEKEVLSKANQRDHVGVRVRLLNQSPWLKGTGNRQDYNITERDYLQYLHHAGWSGYWILALRPHQYDASIEPLWAAYVQAVGEGKDLIVDLLDWRKGEAFHRPVSNAHHSVEATLDCLGYIHWIQT